MILKCRGCNIYTMQPHCPKCGKEPENPRPAKFSPDDRLGRYRREAKLDMRKEGGLV